MSRALRLALVGLTLTSLGFAYITEAANWSWLGPLLGLTIAAPWIARWSSFRMYRFAWNAAVLATFGLMVHHVTSAGVEHLLEDGLMLAALCQVHLLNNLGRLQKPDLLFFNSFLIAVVTSFLSVDAGYSIVFTCYAPLLVISLQLLALERGDNAPPAAVSRRVLLAGAGRAGLVLVLTMGVFFLMPRDFARKGLFDEDVRLRPPASLARVDFSKNVQLDKLGAVTASNRVVLRVHLRTGSRYEVPQHWRGATLDDFDGRQWTAARADRVLVDRWWGGRRSTGVWERGPVRATTHVAVERLGETGDRLPVPLATQRLTIVQPSDRRNVRPGPDLTVRTRGRSPRRYDLDFGPMESSRGVTARKDFNLLTHTALRPGAVPPAAKALAAQLRRALPADADQAAIVDSFRTHLTNAFAYLPPGADGGASSLEEFLTSAQGGHCEYFASALVILLRTQSIPCRLVTGYRSDEWDEERGVLFIRSRHAHAWVEVYDPQRGWRTVDPTPPSDGDAAMARLGWWTRLRFRMSSWWDHVMGFNATTAEDLRAWIASVPGMMKDRPLSVAGLLLVVFGLAFLRRRWRTARVAPAVLVYERALRRLGVELAPG